MNSDARTIGLAVVLLGLVFGSRTGGGIGEGKTPTSAEGVTMSSVANTSDLLREPQPPIPFFPIRMAPAVEPAPAAPAPREAGDTTRATNISAAAAIAMPLAASEPIVAWHTGIRHPLASLTKLMTAVIAEERIGPEKVVTIGEEDMSGDPDPAGITPGTSFTARDLIAAMFSVSSNNAANALARFFDTTLFIAAMREKSAALGMENTAYADPSGLSPLNQSTIDDLVKLARYVNDAHPELLDLSKQKETVIIERNSGVSRTLRSINEFSGTPDFAGGKTGYTPEAHGNLISIFDIAGVRVLTIVLGTDDRFGATRALKAAAAEALRTANQHE